MSNKEISKIIRPKINENAHELEEGEVCSDSEEKYYNGYTNEFKVNIKTLNRRPIEKENYVDSREWSDMKFLMIGDESTLDYKWDEISLFPNQSFKHLPNADIKSLCNFIDCNINNSFNAVIIFGFHYDFAQFNYDARFGGNDSVLSLRTDINIKEILDTVVKYHKKWKDLHPNVCVIWTTPIPPNFLKQNKVARDKLPENCELKEELVPEYIKLTKKYFDKTATLLYEWRLKFQDIPVLPLTNVLFIHKDHYRKTFSGTDKPKYPSGFLHDGISPSIMMVVFFAYLLMDFIAKNNLLTYSILNEISYLQAENILLSNHPSYAKYLTKSNPHFLFKSPRQKRSSSIGSSDSSKSRSVSMLKSSKSKSHSRHHHRSSKTKRERYKSSESLSSLNASLSSSDSSILSATKTGTKEHVGKELEYGRTLKCLREVHEIQCKIYRKKPESHPLFADELTKFLNSEQSPIIWDNHWSKRLEDIFTNNWEDKKKQLTLEFLNRNKSAQAEHNGDQPPLVIDLDDNLPPIPSPQQSSGSKVKSEKLLFDLSSLGESSRSELDVSSHERSKKTCGDKTKPLSESPIDSDEDFNQIINDPDFLNGLDQLDTLLRNAEICHHKRSKPLDAVKITDDSAECTKEVPVIASSSIDINVKEDFLTVLKMLSHLAKRLGPIGQSVSALYEKHRDDEREENFCINEESKRLLTLVNNRVNTLLKEDLNQVQKAIFSEVSERLNELLVKLRLKSNKFATINIQSIATATQGQDVKHIVEFIKNTLLYHGFSDYKSDDVMKIFMSVKSFQK